MSNKYSAALNPAGKRAASETILGIDFGIKRVGLALSPSDCAMALPLKTIHRSTRQALFNDILQVIRENGIESIVLGLPEHPQDPDNMTSRQIKNFIQSLRRRTPLPIYTVNEDYTSVEADHLLRDSGLKTSQRKKHLDQMAAVLILETFLKQTGPDHEDTFQAEAEP
ncbi:MAG: Holliday junction resolvase RuvX [Desulfonatronovibrionaceae bacterium]